ncbi:MAG: protein kinase [Chloroflexota bacterium]
MVKQIYTQNMSSQIAKIFVQIGAEQGYLLDLNTDGSLTFRLKLKADGSLIESDQDLIIQAIADAALRSGKPLIIRNAMTDSQFANEWDVMRLRVRSVMCVPLWDEDRVTSVLYVENRTKRDVFRQEQVALLEQFGDGRSEQGSSSPDSSHPPPRPPGGEANTSPSMGGIEGGPSNPQPNPVIESPNPRYLLHETIGQGGMGIVHRATDRLTGETVALKQVYPSKDKLTVLSQMVTTTQRNLRVALAQEFQIVAGMRHPHVISVLDYGFGLDQQPYFTMTYLPDAQTFLQAGEKPNEAQKLELIRQLLQALAYLHRRGVIHRDLKPSNVLVSKQRVHVLDFGLSASQDTTLTSVGGTLSYLAPELFDKGAASTASDLYAVGVMAYELFAGRHPYDVTSNKFVYQVANDEPDLTVLGIDERLMAVIGQLLAKRPADRYQGSAELCLQAFLQAMGEETPLESAAIRESYLQASRFVGRDAELAQLRVALGEAKVGRGSLWLLGGESGVGKSRLLNELRILALVDGVQVLRGQAIAEGATPFRDWRDLVESFALNTELSDLEASVLKVLSPRLETILGRSIPDAPRLEGLGNQQRLIFILADLLRRQTQPTLLLLEDLHWATESLEPLQQIVTELETHSMLIIGSYRNDERPDLAAAFSDQAKQINLSRLGENEVTQLAEAMLGEVSQEDGLVSKLVQETEGNIFFLVEILRAWAEEAGGLGQVRLETISQQVLTGGILDIVRKRLGKVPTKHQPLLRLAAVVGRKLDLKLLGQWQEAAALEAWLLACSEAMVIAVQEGEWRFAHDKLREVLLQDLPPLEKQQTHEQVALAIEQVYENLDDQAIVLFSHWQVVGNPDKAMHYGIKASEQLLWSGSYDQAIAVTQQLLGDYGQAISAAVKLELLRLVGNAYRGLDRYPESLSSHQAGLALARQVGDQKAVAQHLNGLGRSTWREIQYKGTIHIDQAGLTQAEMYLQEALTLSEMLDDPSETGHVLRDLGIVLNYRDGDTEKCIQYTKQALTLFQTTGETDAIVLGLHDLALAMLMVPGGEIAQAKQYLLEALSLSRQIGNPQTLPFILDILSGFASFESDWQAFESYVAEFLKISRNPRAYHYIRANHMAIILACHRQDYETALNYITLNLNQGGLREFEISWTWSAYGAVSLLQMDQVRLKECVTNSIADVRKTYVTQLACLATLKGGQYLLDNDHYKGAGWLLLGRQHLTISTRPIFEESNHVAEIIAQIEAKYQASLATPEAKAGEAYAAQFSLAEILASWDEDTQAQLQDGDQVIEAFEAVIFKPQVSD